MTGRSIFTDKELNEDELNCLDMKVREAMKIKADHVQFCNYPKEKAAIRWTESYNMTTKVLPPKKALGRCKNTIQVNI